MKVRKKSRKGASNSFDTCDGFVHGSDDRDGGEFIGISTVREAIAKIT